MHFYALAYDVESYYESLEFELPSFHSRPYRRPSDLLEIEVILGMPWPMGSSEPDVTLVMGRNVGF